MIFERPQLRVLAKRLREPRKFIQVLWGPRQVGKTTLVQQLAGRYKHSHRIVSADEPTLKDQAWLHQQWEAARIETGSHESLLVVDEVQKIQGWPETVKRLWDEDSRAGRKLKVVLLGSAPLLVQRGLSESLAGRFETLHLPHWSFSEMREAFGWSLDAFILHGGYPGSAPLVRDHTRWRRYILDSLIETTVSRDVLLLTRVDKPALLRRLFELASRYSGQILSYTKMLGQLQDAGNATTLAHYLDLLAGAGMVSALQKYASDGARSRGSIPKLQVFNTALMTAQMDISTSDIRLDPALWGRLVESAVGAHLLNGIASGAGSLYYWRERNAEVDFVFRKGRKLIAIEVKSGRKKESAPGTQAFLKQFRKSVAILVGGDGIPVEKFLLTPIEKLVP